MSAGRVLTGWVLVRIRGAEPERMLQAMADRGLPFWDASPPEDFVCTLKTDVKTSKKLLPLAASMGCEAEVSERHGLPELLGALRRRACLGLLLLLMLLLLAEGQARIWSIRVTGCETIPEQTVLHALADCGVKIGARWVDMSQDAVRNAMILRLPEIRWMTVTMEGSRARAIIRERRMPVGTVPEDEYAAVRADKAGLVLGVTAKRGTAVTEPGRMILPGETIIDGYATGRLGILGPVRAIGSARVRTWYDLTAAAPVTVTEKNYTGRTRELLSLVLGNFRVNFYKGSSICPGDCDKIILTHTLGREDFFQLPISLERTILREFDPTEERALELTEELQGLLMEELTRRIGESGIIRSAAFGQMERDGMLYMTLSAECEEDIGVTEPLTQADLAEIRSKIPRTKDQDP